MVRPHPRVSDFHESAPPLGPAVRNLLGAARVRAVDEARHAAADIEFGHEFDVAKQTLGLLLAPGCAIEESVEELRLRVPEHRGGCERLGRAGQLRGQLRDDGAGPALVFERWSERSVGPPLA